MGDFNKTIIPLALVRYEMIIANSYPTRTRGIIVNYIFGIQLIQKRFSFFKRQQMARHSPVKKRHEVNIDG